MAAKTATANTNANTTPLIAASLGAAANEEERHIRASGRYLRGDLQPVRQPFLGAEHRDRSDDEMVCGNVQFRAHAVRRRALGPHLFDRHAVQQRLHVRAPAQALPLD